jgi:dynein heavy chain
VDVKDLPSLKQVMDGQSEVREVQSSVSSEFTSIIDRYNTLEAFLPVGGLGKDEMDAKSVLKTQWDQILSASSTVREQTVGLQDEFKTDLVTKVRAYKKDVKAFRHDYEENGPMVHTHFTLVTPL